jgi:hypothetical protein
MKIRPVGADLSHAETRTDGHDEANSGFSQFCEKRLNMLYYQNEMTSPASQIQRCITILNRQQFAQREMDCMSLVHIS